MIPEGFRGRALPRSAEVFETAAEMLGVEVAAIRAVVAVEAAGSGFLGDGRPKILFERHKFSQFTERKFDQVNPSISNRTAGGYIGGGAEYGRLADAMALDRQAALRSASWGAAQIMGFNHALAGYGSVESMVAAFCDSEDAHILGMVAFIKSAGLADALRRHDWAAFARGYNGPAYAQNQYDVKLERAYVAATGGQGSASRPLSETERVQRLLNAHGYGPLVVDGINGPKTIAAIREFQFNMGLKVDGIVGPQTMAALSVIPQSPIPEPPSAAEPSLLARVIGWIISLFRRS